jgi:hypothetical protein
LAAILVENHRYLRASVYTLLALGAQLFGFILEVEKAWLYWSILENLAVVVTVYVYSVFVIRKFQVSSARSGAFGCKIVATTVNCIVILLLGFTLWNNGLRTEAENTFKGL